MLMVLGGAAALLVGSFLPWLSFAAPGFGRVATFGVEGDGVFTAVFSVVALVVAAPLFKARVLSRARSFGLLGLAFLSIVLTVNTAIRVSGAASELDVGRGRVGIGLMICVAAALSLGIGTIMALSAAADQD